MWPRTISTSAPSPSLQTGARRAGGSATSGTKRALGPDRRHQRPPLGRDPVGSGFPRSRAARRSATSASNRSPKPCARPSASGRTPRSSSRSCSSSGLRASGSASATTASTAAGSSPPIRSAIAAGRPRRTVTARARRSSSGASSRKAYGLAFRISCAKTDGSGSSRPAVRMRPSRRSPPAPRGRPSASIASTRQSRMVSRTSGWSGTSMAPPPWLSWQAVWAGNTAASRSSARMRWSAGGTRLPPRRAAGPASGSRSSASGSRTSAPAGPPGSAARPRRSACSIEKTVSSGKLCCGPSERTMPSSVAAACSSKSKCGRSACAAPCPRPG